MSVKIYNSSFIDKLPAVIEADVAGMSVMSLIDLLDSQYGSEVKSTLIPEGILAEGYRILLNGSVVHDLDSFIPDESKVMFSLIILGG